MLVPKRMLIMYVPEKKVNELVKLITDVARTGKIGDGKIFVTPAATAEEGPI